MAKKRVLFFTPNAIRTGSEMALWNFLRYADRSGFDAAFASYADGALRRALPPDVPTFAFYGAEEERFRKKADLAFAFATGRGRAHVERRFFERVQAKFKPDVWYLNTNVLERPLAFVEEKRIPCVLHVHELLETLYQFQTPHLERAVRYPSLVLACSEAARSVMRTLGRAERIEVVPEPVDLAALERDDARRASVRKALGIPETAFLWAMSGFYSPRKNPAGFLEAARALASSRPDARFLWIGGNPETAVSRYFQARTDELGLRGRVFWQDEKVDDYADFLHAADGFVLTSLEESFSMVTVEALALGKPVVAMRCGGVAEFLDERIGILVDLSRQEGLVPAMLSVMEGRFRFDARAAREKAESFDAPRVAARWASLLQKHFERL